MPEGFDANDVLKTAYYRYNTSLGTGLNKLNGRVFRIGHLGALDEGMIDPAFRRGGRNHGSNSVNREILPRPSERLRR